MSAGLFDPFLIPAGTFDPALVSAAGWFDDDLIDVAVPQNYTITAESGSFALAGQAASVEVGRVVGAGSGAIAETGTPASLTVGRRLSAETGAIAETGADASLEVGRVLGAASGDATLTGSPATLSRGRTLVAVTGVIVVTGVAAGVAHGRLPPAPVVRGAIASHVTVGRSVAPVTRIVAEVRHPFGAVASHRALVAITTAVQPVVLTKGVTMAIHYVGTRIRIEGKFTQNGAPFDPSVVKFAMRTPGLGGTTSLVEYIYGTHSELVRESTGNYHVEIVPSFTGTARYRWDSTGQAQESADEGEFTVLPRGV